MSSTPPLPHKASLRDAIEDTGALEPPLKKPVKRRRTQAERTAFSDARMLDAATGLIIEQGTHATTLKAVGERAGFSRGLASNRFGSKDALFAQLILRFNAGWTRNLASAVNGRTGIEACLAALDAVEGFLIEHSEDMKAMYILWFESISSHNNVRSHLADYHRIYRRDVAHWVDEGQQAGDIDRAVDGANYAFQFCSFIFGTVYQWLVSPGNVDLASEFEGFRETTCSVLKPRP